MDKNKLIREVKSLLVGVAHDATRSRGCESIHKGAFSDNGVKCTVVVTKCGHEFETKFTLKHKGKKLIRTNHMGLINHPDLHSVEAVINRFVG